MILMHEISITQPDDNNNIDDIYTEYQLYKQIKIMIMKTLTQYKLCNLIITIILMPKSHSSDNHNNR